MSDSIIVAPSSKNLLSPVAVTLKIDSTSSSLPEKIGDAEILEWMNKGALAPLIEEWICWNNSPLRHVPFVTLQQFFSEKIYSAFLEETRVRIAVDAVLKTKLSWDEPVSWLPNDRLWNIAMIPPQRFQRLAFLGAGFIFAQEIAQIIDGSVIRHLHEELGEDLIQFILLSAAPSKYQLPALKKPQEGSLTLMEALKQTAIKLVEHAFSSKEHGVQKRIATKLPGCFAQGCALQALPLASEAEQILSALWKETSSWI